MRRTLTVAGWATCSAHTLRARSKDALEDTLLKHPMAVLEGLVTASTTLGQYLNAEFTELDPPVAVWNFRAAPKWEMSFDDWSFGQAGDAHTVQQTVWKSCFDPGLADPICDELILASGIVVLGSYIGRGGNGSVYRLHPKTDFALKIGVNVIKHRQPLLELSRAELHPRIIFAEGHLLVMELMRGDVFRLYNAKEYHDRGWGDRYGKHDTALRDADYLGALAKLVDKLPTLKMYYHEDVKWKNMFVSKGTPLRFVPGDWDHVKPKNEHGDSASALDIFEIYKEFVEDMLTSEDIKRTLSAITRKQCHKNSEAVKSIILSLIHQA